MLNLIKCSLCASYEHQALHSQTWGLIWSIQYSSYVFCRFILDFGQQWLWDWLCLIKWSQDLHIYPSWSTALRFCVQASVIEQQLLLQGQLCCSETSKVRRKSAGRRRFQSCHLHHFYHPQKGSMNQMINTTMNVSHLTSQSGHCVCNGKISNWRHNANQVFWYVCIFWGLSVSTDSALFSITM